MLINQSRVRSMKKRLACLSAGTDVLVAVRGLERFTDELSLIGLEGQPEVGDRILPEAVGPVSKYNKAGRQIVHRDRPMETRYRRREWTWTQWRGRDREEVTDYRDVPYQAYPRTFVPPPAVEISVATTPDGQLGSAARSGDS